MKDQEKSQFSIKLEKIYAQYDADKKEAYEKQQEKTRKRVDTAVKVLHGVCLIIILILTFKSL